MPRRAPTQERAVVTVDAIVEAAAQLIVEDGYARLSTNRVARRAGVGIGTLYQYFADKEAIVRALVDRMADAQIEAFGRALVEVAAQAPGVEPSAGLILEAFLSAGRPRDALERRLLLEAPRAEVDLERAWRRRSSELLRAQLQTRRGSIRDGDVELMAHVLVTAGFAVLLDARAWRPELLESGVLREELALLASRYLAR